VELLVKSGRQRCFPLGFHDLVFAGRVVGSEHSHDDETQFEHRTATGQEHAWRPAFHGWVAPPFSCGGRGYNFFFVSSSSTCARPS